MERTLHVMHKEMSTVSLTKIRKSIKETRDTSDVELSGTTGSWFFPLVSPQIHPKPTRFCGIPRWSHTHSRFGDERPGQFTVDSANWKEEALKDPFDYVINMPMWKLMLGYWGGYAIFMWLLTLAFYILTHVEHESLIPDSSWWSCFQCAWQSLTTVGYGTVATNAYFTSFLGCTAVVMSLIFDAVGVGVFYQKFSNASLKTKTILRSERGCICRAQPARARFPNASDAAGGMPMRFECRAHHLSDHALVDSSAKMTMARWRSGQGGTGRVSVEFIELTLGNKTPTTAWLQYPYSIVHYIDETSPLAEYIRAADDGTPVATPGFAKDRVEVIVTILGTAAATGNTCESRASYTVHNMDFGHRFSDALVQDHEGKLIVLTDAISRTEKEEPNEPLLPQCF